MWVDCMHDEVYIYMHNCMLHVATLQFYILYRAGNHAHAYNYMYHDSNTFLQREFLW